MRLIVLLAPLLLAACVVGPDRQALLMRDRRVRQRQPKQTPIAEPVVQALLEFIVIGHGESQKSQTPNSKSQTNFKSQIPSVARKAFWSLEFGILGGFELWDLGLFIQLSLRGSPLSREHQQPSSPPWAGLIHVRARRRHLAGRARVD